MAVGWPRECVDAGASFPTEPNRAAKAASCGDGLGCESQKIGNGAEVEGETEA